MAPPRISKEIIDTTFRILKECGGNKTLASRRLGISRSGLETRLLSAEAQDILYQPDVIEEIEPKPTPEHRPEILLTDPHDRVVNYLKKQGSAKLDDIAKFTGITRGQSLDILERISTGTLNLHQAEELWSIVKESAPAYVSGTSLKYISNLDDTFCFGVTSDNHLGSKYERLDALSDSYDRFKKAGITKVFNCGNYVEGEAEFNKYEIHTHGMDQQITYLINNYPRIDGIDTYAVSGNDHEGWWAKRFGINIGSHVENMMRNAGRNDWHDLGYMEAHVELINANTNKSVVMAVVHPGGGSAYAESYAVQKTIETLDGGEKPAVGLYGHWHKMLAGEYRNVFFVLVPSTKDQDTFMRSRRIRSVVGAGIITLEQDPETGAILGFTPKLWRYFAKGYYNNRWSHSGPVSLVERDTK